jgi:glycosyltransferase involved in cell wall biosynthesis
MRKLSKAGTRSFVEQGVRSVVLPALVRQDRSDIGGTAAYVTALERQLRARGIEVTLLGYGTDSNEDATFRSIVNRTNAQGRHISWALWRKRKTWDFAPESILHLQRPDHVPAFQHGPWPIVLTFHGRHQRTVALRGGPMAGAFYKRIERKACERADAVIFVSQRDADAIMEEHGLGRERTHFIPVGVDRNVFHRQDRETARDELGLPAKTPAVGYAGRLAKEKNVMALIDAIDLVPDAELWIAGEGPLEEECRRRAGPRVRFLGFVPRDEMPRFLSACDVLALSSLHEGLPTVVLEAWACGTPVIAPAVGDLPRLLQDGGGALVSNPDSRELGAAMKEMLAHRPKTADLRQAEANTLRERSATYDWTNVTDRIVEVYEDALNRRRAGRGR